VAGLTLLSFQFRLCAGSLKGLQAVDFLRALIRPIPQPPLLVWDRLPAHRSRVVRGYLGSLGDWVQMEYLPP